MTPIGAESESGPIGALRSAGLCRPLIRDSPRSYILSIRLRETDVSYELKDGEPVALSAKAFDVLVRPCPGGVWLEGGSAAVGSMPEGNGLAGRSPE